MSKIKSIFLFLTLGALTLSGCQFSAFKEVDNEIPNGQQTEEKYTVSFDANGGYGSMNPVENIKGEYTLPECSFTGPNSTLFCGWKINNEGDLRLPTEVINVASDITLYAQWYVPVTTYSIYFDANGGVGTMRPMTVEEGGTADLPRGSEVSFRRDGYDFNGWMLTPNGTATYLQLNYIHQDTTVYASWIPSSSKFDDKKLAIEAIGVDEAHLSHLDYVATIYGTGYFSFFKGVQTFQLVCGPEGQRNVLGGTYTEANGVATIYGTYSWIEQYEFRYEYSEADRQTSIYSMYYNQDDHKYTMQMEIQITFDDYMTVTFVASDTFSEPEYFPVISIPYIYYGSDANGWEKIELRTDPDVENQYVRPVSFEEGDEFFINYGYGSWISYEFYTGNRLYAGNNIVEGQQIMDGYHYFRVLESGVYVIYFNISTGVNIIYEKTEANVLYRFHFKDSYATLDGALLYAWVWGIDGADAHWVELPIEFEDEEPVSYIFISNYMYHAKVVRFNPDSPHPSEGSTVYGDWTGIWNETADFNLSGSGGECDILFLC